MTASSSAAPSPVDSTAPAAVTGLSASAGDGSVSLSWAASSSSDVVRYDVYRTAPGARIKVSSASQGTSRTFVDTGLVNGTTYSYVVRAVDGSGNESLDSSSVSATPVAGSPPPSGALAADSFSRTVSGGWGSANTGGAWSVAAGSASGMSVDGAQGRIGTPAGGLQQFLALNSVSVRDVDAQVAVTFPNAPTSGRHIAYLVLRRQISGAYFRIGLVFRGLRCICAVRRRAARACGVTSTPSSDSAPEARTCCARKPKAPIRRRFALECGRPELRSRPRGRLRTAPTPAAGRKRPEASACALSTTVQPQLPSASTTWR